MPRYDFTVPTSATHRHAAYQSQAATDRSAVKTFDAALHGEVHGLFKEARQRLDYSWHVTESARAGSSYSVRRYRYTSFNMLAGQTWRSKFAVPVYFSVLYVHFREF